MRLALILSSLPGCLAACARSNGNAPASVVTDSAGITIVASRQPAWQPANAMTSPMNAHLSKERPYFDTFYQLVDPDDRF